MAQTTIDFSSFTDGTAGGGTGDNVLAAGGLIFTITANGNWTAGFSNGRFNFAEDPAVGGQNFAIAVTRADGALFDFYDYQITVQETPEFVASSGPNPGTWPATVSVGSTNWSDSNLSGSGLGGDYYRAIFGGAVPPVSRVATFNIADSNIIDQTYSGTGTIWIDNITVDYGFAPAVANFGAGDSLTYTPGSGAVVVDAPTLATVSDADSTGWSTTGRVRLSITGRVPGEDALGLRNEGTGAGQIGVSGTDVTYGGTIVGTLSGGGTASSSITVTLNASATNAAVDAIIHNLTYSTNAASPTGTRGLNLSVRDADNLSSNTYSSTISFAAVNAAPVATASGGTTAAVEQVAIIVDGSLTVTDSDDANLEGATVSITTGFQSGQDVLGFTNQNGISGSYNSGTGVLTLSGTATVAQYQAALQSITYTNSSNTPNTTNRVVSFVVSDGTANSTTTTKTVSVTGVNDLPTGVVSVAGVPAEDALLTAVTPTLADLDGLGTLHYQWQRNSGGGFINVGVDSQTYGLGDADVGATMRVVVSYTDGQGTLESVTSSATGTVTGVNDPPSGAGLPASRNFTEDTQAALDLSSLTLADVDSTSITLTLSFASGTLSLAAPGGIPVSLSGNATSVVTLTGAPADIEAYLNIPTNTLYTPALNFAGNTSLTVTVKDADGSADIPVGTVTLAVAAVNDAPLANASGGTTAASEQIPVAIDNGLTLADVDNANLTGATVSITGGFQAGEDGLGFVNQNGISGSYNAGTGVLTLSGTASIAQYQAALRSVTYTNSSDTPNTASRTVSFIVNDGTAPSTATTKTVSVTGVNDPHTGGASITGTATEDQVLTAVSTLADLDGLGTLHYDWQRDTGGGFATIGASDQATYTLGDADVGATIRVVISYTDGQGSAESATSAATGAVAPVNDPHTGGASVTGTATEDQTLTAVSTLADVDGLGTLHYQWQRDSGGGFINVGSDQATYTLGDADVGAAVRVVISYTDGQGFSESATSAATAAISGINDAPSFGGSLNGTPAITEGGAALVLDSSVQVNDVELAASGNYAGASLTLARQGGANAQDVFSGGGALGALTQGGNLVVSGTTIGTVTQNAGGTLVLTFNASATQALVNAGLSAIRYANPTAVAPATITIGWTFSDGNAGSQGTGGALTATGSTVVSITTPPVNVINDDDTGHTLFGTAGRDFINGNGGNDTVFANAGLDTVHGGDGNDTLVGNSDIFAGEADTLLGENGDDAIYAERTDTIHGGAGADIVYAVNAFDFALDMGATSFELAQMEFGNDFVTAATQTVGVTVLGSGGNDTIVGSAFRDVLFGGVGNDSIQGGDGDDGITGEGGIDSLSGGEGNDLVYFDNLDSFVSGGNGSDAGYITSGSGVTINTAAASLEYIQDLAGGNDTILGAAMATGLIVEAGGGNDSVEGGAFADLFYGGLGTDTLTGNDGNDTLYGGAGTDTLSGGAGLDALYGNAGAGGDGVQDVFRFQHSGAANADAVYDFEAGIDKIDLSAFGSSFANVVILDGGGSSNVYLNGQLICTVVGAAGTLTAADFVL